MSETKPEKCSDWAVMLHGFIDGELDSMHALQFEEHLATCANCTAELEKFTELKNIIGQGGVRWQMPERVRERIVTALSHEIDGAPSSSPASAYRLATWRTAADFIRRWSFVPSFAALAAGIFLVLSVPPQTAVLQDEILASHVRSLLVDHLTDVQTSDQHTVKPWFNGKIDYSPPVIDLSAQGFPLVGGRVDYIKGRVVAVLVYRRHGHVMNVFVWPASPIAAASRTREGYNFAEWSSGGLTFWAVSDVSVADLAAFRADFVAAVEK
ncbi:anti-sigma factor [uncultured Phyllobacterium sp.]|uniref:anti-sigma factor family protein n=1 Tax=uncultured Phyllobacterium sp. TaxID=253813 RepID=UPI00258A12AE|nr:anti-sigma factor [uncultured Phyllobacterium sp.]